MLMKKKLISYILSAAALLLASAGFAYAESGWFVNDSSTELPQFFDGVYAIGSGGAAPLSADSVYALTANGLELLGSANPVGGGGLVYDGHAVKIASRTVSVGLKYYYSASRDSSVASAELKNSFGSGFAVGYLDENGEFIEVTSTEAAALTVKASVGTSVWVCENGSDIPFYSADFTGRNSYLVVRPISDFPTAFSGYKYYGDFGFAVIGGGKLTVVNLVDIEQYVMGVCACEMSESWPTETLKAQAVASRTYVQKMAGSSVYYYSCGFDVTADTYCQAYHGDSGVGKNIIAAVTDTENQYLTYQDTLINAMYSASDGGATESNLNVYGSSGDAYLCGVIDPYEASAVNNPYGSWRVTMMPAELGAKVGIDAVKSITPTYSDTGNVIKLDFVSVSGKKATVIRDSCRTVMGLKSIHYEISNDDAGNFVFTGGGFGHNLGMSQWGAYAMAKYFEKDYQSILGFYYTGVGLSYGELK